MDFEIDVSGEDILNRNYTVVLADKNDLVKSFKFNQDLIRVLRSRQGEGRYRYPTSKQGKSLLRVRLYCIIVYYLFRSVNIKNKIVYIDICKDFYGHEKDISSNLRYFLGEKLGLNIHIRYLKLPKESNADKYAYLMRKDVKNKMQGYVNIRLKEIEKFLIKK